MIGMKVCTMIRMTIVWVVVVDRLYKDVRGYALSDVCVCVYVCDRGMMGEERGREGGRRQNER